MKRLLFIISLLCLLSSCDRIDQYGATKYGDSDQLGFYVQEVTIKGKTHEYVFYRAYRSTAMEHLPECKYCKRYTFDFNRISQ